MLFVYGISLVNKVYARECQPFEKVLNNKTNKMVALLVVLLKLGKAENLK
jgi:hypothetical protein